MFVHEKMGHFFANPITLTPISIWGKTPFPLKGYELVNLMWYIALVAMVQSADLADILHLGFLFLPRLNVKKYTKGSRWPQQKS